MRYAEESTQKLAPQNFRNSRFVRAELEVTLCCDKRWLFAGFLIVAFPVSRSSDVHAIKLIGSNSVVNTSFLC